jgi:hypothetical protein
MFSENYNCLRLKDLFWLVSVVAIMGVASAIYQWATSNPKPKSVSRINSPMTVAPAERMMRVDVSHE